MDRISLLKIITGVLLAVLFISGCTGDIDEMKKGIVPESQQPVPTVQETEKKIEKTAEVVESPSESMKSSGIHVSVTGVEEKQTAQAVISGGSSSPSVKLSESKSEREGVGSKSFGYLQLLVSDKPADISDFSHLYVKFYRARIFKAGDSYGYGYSNGKGFVEIGIDVTVDLTELVGENALPIAEIQLEEGTYTKIELYVESAEGILRSSYGYGYGYTVADVKVPSNKLKIVKPFEIKSGEETKFVFDINVVKKGNKNEYNLLPVVSKSGVIGEDLKESEVKIIKK